MERLEVQPPEDTHGEREHRHQQHAHVLAALLQPKHPDILDLSPAPAINLLQPYPDTCVPHGLPRKEVEGLQQRQGHEEGDQNGH